MIKKAKIPATLILLLFCMAKATAVNISTITDKETYLLGEQVIVSVTAYNPDPNPVTLSFATSLEASYLMDDVYDWTEGKYFTQLGRQLTIDPYDSYTWDLPHGQSEMELYSLDIGIHTVRGEVVEYGYSSTIQFEVVPEPATTLLLTLGSLFLARRRRKKMT
jgi:hypothetical protein